MKFRKGDWVVFPGLNTDPTKLEKGELTGYFPDKFFHRTRFYESNLDNKFVQDADQIVSAVQDPRQAYNGFHEIDGFYEVSLVRHATKKDFDETIGACKRTIAHRQKILKEFTNARKKAPKQ